MRAWAADLLVIVGLAVMTLGVLGLFRMPTVYAQLHAASKAVFLGVVALLVATSLAGDVRLALRAVLVGSLLLLTTPAGAHAVARAAYLAREEMAPGAVDESGRTGAGTTRREG